VRRAGCGAGPGPKGSGHGTVRRPGLRAAMCWVACVALLLDVLLRAALSVGVGLLDPRPDTINPGLCSSEPSRNLPVQGKPVLLAHHCALCTVPATLPPRRAPAIAYETRIADAGYPRVQPTSAPTPFRHGRVQARAPPIAA
jgi:hypothetical protein